MTENNLITIENDTELTINCNVYINDNYIDTFKTEKEVYTLSSKEDKIRVYKENIWNQKSIINDLFLFFFTLDFTFGTGILPENMPYSIDFAVTLSQLYQHQIKLSEHINVTLYGLNKWKKFMLFQRIALFLLIGVIIVIGSFMFNGAYKFFYLLILFLGDIVLLFFIKKKHEVLEEKIKKFIKTENS